VISHYNRIQRLRALRPKLIVVDESHNVAIPRMHEVRAGALEVVLEKLGFGGMKLVHTSEAQKHLR